MIPTSLFGDNIRLYDVDMNEVGLAEVCNWWISKYPEDVFVKEPKDIVTVRECMQNILNSLNKRKPKEKK